MAKTPKRSPASKKSVEAKRKNIPTAEYRSMIQKSEQASVRVAHERRPQGLVKEVQTRQTCCYGPITLMACDEYACREGRGTNGK